MPASTPTTASASNPPCRPSLAPAIDSALPTVQGAAQPRRELVVVGSPIDAAIQGGFGGCRLVQMVRRSLLLLSIAGLLLGHLPHLRRSKDRQNKRRNRRTFGCSNRKRTWVYRAAANGGRRATRGTASGAGDCGGGRGGW